MDHDIGIGKSEALAFGASAKQNRSHACGHAEAIGRHIARKKLHRVVNGKPCRYRSARRVNVDIDVLLCVLHLQKEQLRDDQIGDVIVHWSSNENNAVLQEPRVNVVAALAPAGLLHNHRNQHGLRQIFIGYTHDFSSTTTRSCVSSMLTFAFSKSRVLPSKSCSARLLSPSCSCSILKVCDSFAISTSCSFSCSRSCPIIWRRSATVFPGTSMAANASSIEGRTFCLISFKVTA